ncbi:hypothetical protein RB195_019127 [Necator americanus]|uniref:Fucosyltransferase n=1 Tax=Necator americanus TaxID=51031 RepID=A0ABR1CES3_NECAM
MVQARLELWHNNDVSQLEPFIGNVVYFIMVVNISLIEKKTKGAAWFVSNCHTFSLRELYVSTLQSVFPVDVYGGCGPLKCRRGDSCENVLDTDYHFYLAFENSVCKQYITEKLWKHGYQHEIVPVILKRSVVEAVAPPHSFIAVDDFNTIGELGAYLRYLINNKTAYLEYFNWKMDYRAVFLDGVQHDELERPWGYCQLCRLIWQSPRKTHIIRDFHSYWHDSCEADSIHWSRHAISSNFATEKNETMSGCSECVTMLLLNCTIILYGPELLVRFLAES